MLFLLVGLTVGLEIDCVPEVFRAGKHMGNGAVCPGVIAYVAAVVGDVPSVGLGVGRGVQHMTPAHFIGNL